jgi:tetratricopeptide (TPR) repeat protein
VIELLLAAENTLALGLLDQAERTYRQVLAADPRNAIAVVGLSRVALERGDKPGAIALAHEALAIDPQNASARRMIDRLEEVARYREAAATGEPVAPRDGVATGQPGATGVPAATGGVAAPRDAASPRNPGAAPASPPSPDRAGPDPARPGLLRRLLRRS